MSLRDRAIEFVETHIRAVIASVGGILALLVLVLAAALIGDSSKRSAAATEAAERAARAIRPEEFRLPSDPIPVPGVQRFRERKRAWSAEEAKSWYAEPSVESLEALRYAAKTQIDSILEGVP